KEEQRLNPANLMPTIEEKEEEKSHHHEDRQRHIDPSGNRRAHPLKAGSQNQRCKQPGLDPPEGNAGTVSKEHPDNCQERRRQADSKLVQLSPREREERTQPVK